VEEMTIDVAAEYAGAVMSEIGRRRGVLVEQLENADSTTRLIFHITTRAILGLRSRLLTLSRGTATMNSLFLRYQPAGPPPEKLRNGALVASESGKAVAFGLNNAQNRGTVFIGPQTPVYAGMIIGLNSRDEDLAINVAKEKKLTNLRAAGADDAVSLTPPTVFDLEQSLDFLEDDELLEATPASLRLRKKILDAGRRARAKKSGKRAIV
jgi:GTP-binding protein